MGLPFLLLGLRLIKGLSKLNAKNLTDGEVTYSRLIV